VPSAGLAIRPIARRGAGRLLADLSASLRRLPMPVIGRIENDGLILDLRCLDDEEEFMTNIAALGVPRTQGAAIRAYEVGGTDLHRHSADDREAT
jgi:L-seryl-tRNA(Ser) seleniumtransferase